MRIFVAPDRRSDGGGPRRRLTDWVPGAVPGPAPPHERRGAVVVPMVAETGGQERDARAS
ncbi:MAG TPA: hypothetical protein VEK76_06455 [Candidatus Binatia bacterium]|nr:hypothetical protein [Candidatus Binatia bacterium]